MKRLLSALAALLLFLPSQAAWAHGPEKHEGQQSAQVEAGTAVSQMMEPADAGPAGEPAADGGELASGSVFTKLHPATVHFPIALLLAAALTQVIAIARPSTALESAVRVMVWGGAIGAIVAALFGWIHTGLWFGGSATMQWHRWTGTGLAILATVTAILGIRSSIISFRSLLFICAAAVLAQGYWGGELAHGPDHLGF